jgi:protein O-mannosyl-transferase
MKRVLPLIILPFLVFSQTEKGAKSSPSGQLIQPTKTFAVVIGISDYQDPGIPDLQFADKDAEAFANFLRSPAGGLLDNNQLKILTNHNATAGRIAEAMDWLVEQTKEGQQAIIYFSGHGDVERKTISQPGFLLCWDAPGRIYMGGGTYSLSFLQEIITTLSIQNKAKVMVVTDACHAGKLAGSQIGGAQLTTANLAKQFANEIKIMSCQPGEFALEGEQWGGGRGVFSYHLVDGLFGLADRNEDGIVTLGEIDRYLEDNVTAEVAPQSQVPMFMGNKTERLSVVNAQILSALQRLKNNQMAVFMPIEQRGLEDLMLEKLDSTIRLQYLAFKKSVKEKRFFEPQNDCSEYYYQRLSQIQQLEPLLGFMKRHYAAALQDDAQQTLNKWLTTTIISPEIHQKGSLPVKEFSKRIKAYPRCLDRAAELLGKAHYMYSHLIARKYFFEAYIIANSNLNIDKENGESALKMFRSSLEWQQDQPHVYWQMSRIYGTNIMNVDSMEYYAKRSIEAYPNWLMPIADIAYLLSYNYNLPERAKRYLEQAEKIDSNDISVLNSWGTYYYFLKNQEEAERKFKKAYLLDSTNALILNNLGYIYMNTNRLNEAEMMLKKAISIDSTSTLHWSNLGIVYMMSYRFEEAEIILKKSVEVDSMLSRSWDVLASLYVQLRRFDEAEYACNKALALDATNVVAWVCAGGVYANTGRIEDAENAYKKAVELDSMSTYTVGRLASFYGVTRRFEESEIFFKKAIKLDPTNVDMMTEYSGMLNMMGRFDDAIHMAKKAINLDSMYLQSYNSLGFGYLSTGRLAEAEQTFVKGLSLADHGIFPNPHKHLGMVYLKTQRPAEARKSFQKAISINPNYVPAILSMAYAYAYEGKTNEALLHLETAVQKGIGYEQLERDAELNSLRALPEWKIFIKKHFPDKGKD